MTTAEVTPEVKADETPDGSSKTVLLETWSQNEKMRHIPSISWMVQKLDDDIRKRVEKLLVSFTRLDQADAGHEPLDRALRSLCRAIDRLADTARHQRPNNHAPQDLPSRIGWAISQAVMSLQSIDESLFGRRYPFQTHERSKAEVVYGAFLTVLSHVERTIPLVRAIDPGIDERLYEGLVVLQEPLRKEPIA